MKEIKNFFEEIEKLEIAQGMIDINEAEAIKGISFKPTSDLRMHESHNESETSIVFGMYNKLLVFCVRY